MKKYTLVFLFDVDLQNVWLIEKNKPDWQKGCLNGIGGKIEEGETPMDCVIREVNEESGIRLKNTDIQHLGRMQGVNNDYSDFLVEIFTGSTTELLQSQEEEIIKLIPVNSIKKYKHIANVPLLVEACIYKIQGSSNFKFLNINY